MGLRMKFLITLLLPFALFAIVYLKFQTVSNLIIIYMLEFLPAFSDFLLITYANLNPKNFQNYFKHSMSTTAGHYASTFFSSCIFSFRIFGLETYFKRKEFERILLLLLPCALIAPFMVVIDFILHFIFKPCKSLKDVEQAKNLSPENLKIKWDVPSKVFWSKVSILTQLGLILGYLSYRYIDRLYTPRFFYNYLAFYGVIIFMVICNYYRMSKWNWIKFERTIENPWISQNRSVKMKISFFLSMLKCSSKKFTSEICTICLERNPTRHFCVNHCFHENCLIGHLIVKCQTILSESRVQPTHHQVSENDIRKPSKDYNSYSIDIKRKHLPLCPNCNRHCEQNVINIKIEDILKGSMRDATICIQD